MKTLLNFSLLFLLALFIFSCEEEEGNNNAPKACFTHPDTIRVGVPARFDATCSENADTYLWNIDQQQSSTDSIIDFIFPSTGEYTVTLQVAGDNATDEVTKNITVAGSSNLEVENDIDVNTTWYADSVYIIKRIIDVNAVLTIQPGTVIKFMEYTEMRCSDGTIKAIGTEQLPIVFTSYRDDSKGGDSNGDGNVTSPAKGDWNYINIAGQNNASEFEYCAFYYGGGHNSYDYTLGLESSQTEVSHCTFAHNKGTEDGVLNAKEAETGNSITNNVFYDNDIPLVIGGTIDIDDSNVFHDPDDPSITNTKNGIFFQVYNGDIKGNRSWAETEVPFVINNAYGVEISSESSLTLSPGVIVKFDSDKDIEAEGIFNAQGTSENPIVFTSYHDDVHGGDTDGNGDLVSPTAGDWHHVYIGGTNNASKMDHCHFYYGGGHNSRDYTVGLESSNIRVTNCTFANNSGAEDGVLNAVDAGTGTVLTGNVFYNNEIPLAIGSQIDIDDSNVFHDPDDHSVTNTKNGIFFMEYNGDIIGNRSWTATEVPFVIMSSYDLDIASGHSLTLAAGVILKFDAGLGLTYIGNNLINYDASNVWYTSYKDDSKGGDTNGDGSITSPAMGDWDGIYNDNTDAYETWSSILYAEH